VRHLDGFRVPVLGVIAAFLIAGCAARPAPEERATRARLAGHVEAIASRIGPRPAGSAAERTAAEYVLEEFRKIGLEARLDPVDTVRVSETDEVVVRSSNVIGIRRGTSPGAIVIGAHHDSRSASCPGAADDASGVAVVLETARLLAGGSPRHTLVFASFAAEETFGLPGSREFVRRQSAGGPIRFALTLDFVGSGRIFLAPFPIPQELWANRVVARASAAAPGRVLFDPWLAAVPRMIPAPFFADHVSFLEAGIPALNLSCEFPRWTYHTVEDRADRVDPGTLLAARDVTAAIVSRLDDRGVPPRGKDPGYLPLPLFGRVVFLTSALLRGLLVVTALLFLAACWGGREALVEPRAWAGAIRSALLCLPLSALAVAGPFTVSGALGALSGTNHPWMDRPNAHAAGAILAGAFSAWLALTLARFLRPTTSPGAYLAPALAVEGGLAAACVSAGRLEIAFPFLAGILAMILATHSLRASRRAAMGILGAAWLVPFLGPGTYRMFLELSGVSPPRWALPAASVAVVFPWFLFAQHIACLPEMLHRRRGGWLSGAGAGALLAVTALAAIGYLATRGPFGERYRALVEIEQTIRADLREAEASLRSLERLDAVRLEGAGGTRLPRATEARIRSPIPVGILPAAEVSGVPQPDGSVRIRVSLSYPGRPRRIAIQLQARGGVEIPDQGSWARRPHYRKVFYALPGFLEEEFSVRAPGADAVAVGVEIAYEEDLLKLRPRAPGRVFRTVALVQLERSVASGGSGEGNGASAILTGPWPAGTGGDPGRLAP
jgi:hypothetical protein